MPPPPAAMNGLGGLGTHLAAGTPPAVRPQPTGRKVRTFGWNATR